MEASDRPEYVELLGRSCFSFLQGASRPEEMVGRALELGYRGMALCDVNGLYGVVRGFRAAERPNAFDAEALSAAANAAERGPFHYMVGSELTPHDASPVTLLPMNRDGYARLSHLITAAKRPAPKGYIALGLRKILAENEDLIALPLPPWNEDDLRRLQDAFQDRLYLPVHRDLTWSSAALGQRAFVLERDLKIPAVATQRPLYHAPERKPLLDVITCILHGTTLKEANVRLAPNRERGLKGPRELALLWRDRPDMIRRSCEIAERVSFSLTELRYRYPQEALPRREAGRPPPTPTEFMRELVDKGLENRFPGCVSAEARTQADKELALIRELEYEDYFITIWDICAFARARGILHQGRGSAANSMVCFALGITSVDPLALGLLFERFISRERGEPPDIDVDFEHERREEVIQYIYEKYGAGHAAMVCTTICYRSRMAVRDVAKVLGFAPDEIDALVRRMGREGLRRLLEEEGAAGEADTAAVFLADADEESSQDNLSSQDDSRAQAQPSSQDDSQARAQPSSQDDLPVSGALSSQDDLPDSQKTQLRWLLRFAAELQGFPRHLGIHSGGFVIARDLITDIVPVEKAAMDGRYVIQWNKDDVDALGLMKIDVLSLGMLTALRKAFALLQEKKGVALSLATLDFDDAGSYDDACKADTIGVFQIESRAQMSLLPRLKPRNYYDLVVEVAIVRPGPIQGGMVHPYLRRREGKEKAVYPHPKLEPILKKTLGVPLFQEQVMQIAVAVGGFTPGEADELRRVMSSHWNKTNVMEGLRHRLISGMLGNGLTPEFAEQIYKTIQGFSAYGFPESHAASFALLTFASLFVKRHHPDVFACALLNSQPMGFYAPRALIADAQRHGVEFQPLDVQSSGWDYALEPVAARNVEISSKLIAWEDVFGQSLAQEREPLKSVINLQSGGLAASAQNGSSKGFEPTEFSTEALDASAFEGEKPPCGKDAKLAVRAGFRAIYGLAQKHVDKLVHERRTGGAFQSLEDFARRAQMPRPILLKLAAAGAFRFLPGRATSTVAETMWALQGMSLDPHSLLFGSHSEDWTAAEAAPDAVLRPSFPAESEWRELQREYKSRGYSLHAHPLSVLRPQLARARPGFSRAQDLLKKRHRERVRIAGLLAMLQKPPTAKGMCFLSLEDETGLFNAVLTPDVYERCRSTVMNFPLLDIVGLLENRSGVRNVRVEEIRPLRPRVDSNSDADAHDGRSQDVLQRRAGARLYFSG